MLRIFGMCMMNWKVLAGLALAGLVLWAVAPNLEAGALPLMVVLACPLSMLLMMPVMMKGMNHFEAGGNQPKVLGQPPRDSFSPYSTTALEQTSRANPTELASDSGQQLARLQAELARTRTEQAHLTRLIAELEKRDAVATGSPAGE